MPWIVNLQDDAPVLAPAPNLPTTVESVGLYDDAVVDI